MADQALGFPLSGKWYRSVHLKVPNLDGTVTRTLLDLDVSPLYGEDFPLRRLVALHW